MVDPRLALAVFAGLLLVAGLLFVPPHGVVPRLLRWSRAGLRVSTEDALKHLFKAERRGTAASVESLAGALERTRHEATRVLRHLRDAGLVQADRPWALTEVGRAYALRVIRTHRLWERYLADRTGMAPSEWHTSAEEREHFLSTAEADRLAARLGDPRFDPHGDPIPTARGEIPAPVGTPLASLRPGQAGLITHLEDEPPTLFDQLVSLGLSPGLPFRVLSREGGSVRLLVDGRDLDLDPVAANNVTVVLSPPSDERAEAEGVTLADVALGETAEVVGLTPACQGVQRQRLLDLGIVPGTRVTAELASTVGDPVAYVVRGALIALRRQQQQWVRVRRRQGEDAA